MKNRTVIGIVCVILAVAVTFVVSPMVNKVSDKKTEVVRFTADVEHGVKITDEHIELVKMPVGTVLNISIRTKRKTS